jgi:2-dehydro-3-deoxyphosphooctonate aldolase (KDO 8-P synthase)
LGNATGGRRQFAPILAKAAIAAGANALFLEVHTNPRQAKSDSAVVMPIEWVEELLTDCRKIFEITSGAKNG